MPVSFLTSLIFLVSTVTNAWSAWSWAMNTCRSDVLWVRRPSARQGDVHADQDEMRVGQKNGRVGEARNQKPRHG